MPTTDTTEAGLETLIVRHLTGSDGLPAAEDNAPTDSAREPPDAIAQALAAGSGWIAGSPRAYDRGSALDVVQLFAFLHATQPEAVRKLGIADYRKSSDAERQKFLARLSNELGKRGVIDVLRKGLDHGPVHLDLFYGRPRRATPRRRRVTPRTVSASFANSATASTRPVAHSICAPSSTACPSPPSS